MNRFRYQGPDGESEFSLEWKNGVLSFADDRVECDGQAVWIEGRRVPFWTHRQDDRLQVWLDGEVYTFGYRDPRQRAAYHETADEASGLIKAQMPGKILTLSVRPGDSVSRGQNLLVMESMKMELALDAPIAGVVSSVDVGVGQLVAQGEVLVRIQTESDENSPS